MMFVMCAIIYVNVGGLIENSQSLRVVRYSKQRQRPSSKIRAIAPHRHVNARQCVDQSEDENY
jgi:hypothetical protein